MLCCPTDVDAFAVLAENGEVHTVLARNEFIEDDAGELLTKYHPLETDDGMLVVTLPDDGLAVLTDDGPKRAWRMDE